MKHVIVILDDKAGQIINAVPPHVPLTHHLPDYTAELIRKGDAPTDRTFDIQVVGRDDPYFLATDDLSPDDLKRYSGTQQFLMLVCDGMCDTSTKAQPAFWTHLLPHTIGHPQWHFDCLVLHSHLYRSANSPERVAREKGYRAVLAAWSAEHRKRKAADPTLPHEFGSLLPFAPGDDMSVMSKTFAYWANFMAKLKEDHVAARLNAQKSVANNANNSQPTLHDSSLQGYTGA